MQEVIQFNYIITIHNKQNLIASVLEGINRCAGSNSRVYAVIDGCTDETEKVIDDFFKTHQDLVIHKVIVDDVHELLSINAGLDAANHEGYGFNIVLQDDVILKDENFEDRIVELYKSSAGRKLGYISLRLGADLKKNTLKNNEDVPFDHYVENIFGHGLSEASPLYIGEFIERDVAIKSPVCIPFFLYREIGGFDSILAPYGHDDVDYSIRTREAGYLNGVYALEFESDLAWGGTRQDGGYVVNEIIRRNIDYIRVKHRRFLAALYDSEKPIVERDVRRVFASNEEDLSRWKMVWASRKHPKARFLTVRTIVKQILSRPRRKLNALVDSMVYRFKPKVMPVTEDVKGIFRSDLSLNQIYHFMNYFYHSSLPNYFRAHKEYIILNNYGYGERAFSSMWYFIFKEFEPKKVLEIGVFKGQTISYWALLAKKMSLEIEVSGLSPFESIGDEVSDYEDRTDYHQLTLDLFDRFDLPRPNLIKSLSTEKETIDWISKGDWDLIYIDGGHDFDVVLSDYKCAVKGVREGGLIVFDDSALYTNYNCPAFSFKGHPGPSLVARLYADRELDLVGAVGHNTVYQRK